MDLEERALIERIYDAAAEPDRWQDVVNDLSQAFDGAYVGFGLNYPSDPLAGTAYLVGITPKYRRSFAESLIAGLPFAAHFGRDTSKRFIDVGELFRDIELSQSQFYREWMKSQKLAPVWPIGASVWLGQEGPAAWMYVWRPEGGRPFGNDDLALGDLLLPHLHRAVRIHLKLASSEHQHRLLGEVIDRLPAGVLLLDASRRVVSTNRSADRILALKDGFEIGRSGPRAALPRDNDSLVRLISSVLDPEPGEKTQAGGFTAVTRPSGKRSFVAMVTPLLAAVGTPGDAVAIIFIADPEAAGQASKTEVLEKVYQLTHAEADLLRLLSSGYPLEEAAAKRATTMNTARAQLKQVFAKTDTRRQAELLRLVLNGVGTLRQR